MPPIGAKQKQAVAKTQPQPKPQPSNKVDPYQPYWQNTDQSCYLYNADVLEWVNCVQAPFAHMVFADPPFNIGYKYDQHSDAMSKPEYLAWCKRWMTAMRKCLVPTGAIVVCSGVKYQAELKLALEEVGYHWQDTIVWHYGFGPHQKTKLTPSWVALHWATMHPTDYTANIPDIKVPSARQLKYRDRRAAKGGRTPDNVWILDPSQYEHCFPQDGNATFASRVCGTFHERTGHPCQMPLAAVQRCIKLMTLPGECVLDPFVGSGTTAEAALKLQRSCVGVELSKAYLDDYAIPRLKNMGAT